MASKAPNDRLSGDENSDGSQRSHHKHKKPHDDKSSRHGGGSEASRERRKSPSRHDEHSQRSSSRKQSRQDDLWLRAHLRVRIIDRDLKKGKYYKSKVIYTVR